MTFLDAAAILSTAFVPWYAESAPFRSGSDFGGSVPTLQRWTGIDERFHGWVVIICVGAASGVTLASRAVSSRRKCAEWAVATLFTLSALLIVLWDLTVRSGPAISVQFPPEL